LGARKSTTALLLQGLREHSVVLMGKNTLMKRCIRLYAERTKEEKWNVLLDYLVGNVGIIFTNVSTCCL
jgi:large subunit ribosomal protein LP0